MQASNIYTGDVLKQAKDNLLTHGYIVPVLIFQSSDAWGVISLNQFSGEKLQSEDLFVTAGEQLSSDTKQVWLVAETTRDNKRRLVIVSHRRGERAILHVWDIIEAGRCTDIVAVNPYSELWRLTAAVWRGCEKTPG